MGLGKSFKDKCEKYLGFEQMCRKWILQSDEDLKKALFNGYLSKIILAIFELLKVDMKIIKKSIILLGFKIRKKLKEIIGSLLLLLFLSLLYEPFINRMRKNIDRDEKNG